MLQGLGDIIQIQNSGLGNAQSSSSTDNGFSQMVSANGSNQGNVFLPETIGNQSFNRLDKLQSIENLLSQFLKEMQDEVGLQPEAALRSLEKLDLSILNLGPKESLEQFFSTLKVNNQQSERAGEAFLKLVSGLKAITGHSTEQGKDLKVEILSAQEVLKRKRVENLNRLNSSFFSPQQIKAATETVNNAVNSPVPGIDSSLLSQMQNTTAEQSATQFLSQGGIGQSNLAHQENSDINNLSDFFKAASIEAEQVSEKQRQFSSVSNSSVNLADDLVQKLKTLTAASKMASGSLGAYAEANGGGLNQTSVNQNLNQANQGPQAITPEMVLQSMGMEPKTNDQQGQMQDGQNSQSFEELVLGMGQGKVNSTQVTGSGGQKFMIETPQLTPQQRFENVGEIVKQANVLVKDGGGEMTMQLRPEGVGELKLKVMVNDGQVNVQMVANNRQTKALLEDGIADLKLQLANNKLIVEDLKVEMSDDLAKNFEFNQEEANKQEQREFARQFMSSYREEREAFRNNLLGLPNRKFGRPEPSQDIQPIVQTNETKSRLHVVA